MAQLLYKSSKLSIKDLESAPDGEWKESLVSSVNDLVEVADQLRSPGLLARVGSTVVQANIYIEQDWYTLDTLNTDWTNISSTAHPASRVRKYDDGMCELQGWWYFKKSIPSLFITQVPYDWMYPDGLHSFTAMNAGATSIYRASVSARGTVYLESTPSIADYVVGNGSWRWRCANTNAPPKLKSTLVLNHGFGSVASVNVVSCVAATAPTIQLPPPRVCWVDAGNGIVKITNLLGLPGGASYVLKFLCIQG